MSAYYLDPDHVILREGEQIDSVLLCSICQGILINPQECRSCQRSYCFSCINEWRTRSTHCPNLCKKPLYVQAHLIIRNLLDKLIFRCRNDACHEKLSYTAKIKREHEINCIIDDSTSILNLNRGQIEISCTFCDTKFPLKEIKDHEAACPAAIRNQDGHLEICFACNKNTNSVDQCFNCKGLFCSNTCILSCKKCSNMFCFKQCGSRCYCRTSLYCDSCKDGMESTQKSCSCCSLKYKVRCEECVRITTCGKCTKETCQKCSISCEACSTVSCSNCCWNCSQCSTNICNCRPNFNYYISTIEGIYFNCKNFFAPKEVMEWNEFLKWTYLVVLCILVAPVVSLFIFLYSILGGIFFEWTAVICLNCRRSIYSIT